MLLVSGLTSIALLNSCSDDEPAPAEPTISISATGAVDGIVTGDIGSEISVSITIDAEAGFESLTITEYQGTTEIGSETFTTEQTTYSHTITDADFQNPFRVEFEVADAKGNTVSENLIIQVEATNANKLLAYSWLFSKQVWSDDEEVGGDGADAIKDCETDNVQTFYADGSVKYNFGPKTGLDGGDCEGSPNGCEGSCPGDGSAIYTGWDYDTEAEIISVYRADATTEAPLDTVAYHLISFGDTEFTGRVYYDLSALFGFEFILPLDETWTAVAKEDK